MTSAPRSRIRWPKAYRVINSRYPPIDVFERIADRRDFDALLALEQLTNPRVRQDIGEISLVAPEERVFGAGASWVMGAFTHRGKASRFTDGSYGVYYAARELETSVHETAYHFGRFLRATSEPRGTEMELRVLVSSKLDQVFHDIRRGYPELHDPDDYGKAQAFAYKLRASQSYGIVYRSVRRTGFDCLAVFRPKGVPRPRQGAHLRYHFDGERIDRWFQFGDEKWQPIEA